MTQSDENAIEAIYQTQAARKRKLKRLVLLVAVPVVAGLAVGFLYLHGGRYAETENAYVKAYKIPVSAEVSGRVQDVLVEENDVVVSGQVLFQLDPTPFQIELARANAHLAQVRIDLKALKASYQEKKAEIELARTQYDFAVKEQKRQADLAAQNFVSASQLDAARQAADVARQRIDTQEKDLTRIAQALGGSIDVPIEEHPSYRAALAEREQAALNLERTEVHAPVNGIVSDRPKLGQFVSAGTISMIMVSSEERWVEANFVETDLTYVQVGQPVSVHIDTYPDAEWHGVVDSLSPATGAEFSVIPAQNATGNWVKIAQRVPVRIALQEDETLPELRAGLSATVEIDTGHKRDLLGLSL